VLRGHLHDALTRVAEADQAQFPAESLLAPLTLIGAGELVAQSTSQAKTLVVGRRDPASAARPERDAPAAAQSSLDTPPSSRTLAPTMALAIQVVVAALESHLPGQRDRSAKTGTELDRAHSALDSIVASAATETHVFPQPGSP
jgi:hypothetical protein